MTVLTLSVDDSNDLFIGSDGALALTDGYDALQQAVAQAAKTQQGECVLQVDVGIPNFAVVWNGAPSISQFDAAFRRAIKAVPDVVDVDELTITNVGGVLAYAATISTTYGKIPFNG